MPSIFPASIQSVPKSQPDTCLPEGRRIVTFQQDLFLLTWVLTTFRGNPAYHSQFVFNIRSANQQPLTALQSLIVSIVTGNASEIVFAFDTGNNIPIFIGPAPDATTDSCFYGIFPFLTSDDTITVDVYMSNAFDPNGLVNGLVSLGVANFQIDPVIIASPNTTST